MSETMTLTPSSSVDEKTFRYAPQAGPHTYSIPVLPQIPNPEAEAAVKKIKIFSTTALIVGVLSLFFYLYVGFIGVAAVGAGIAALALNKGYESRGLAIAGILLGAAGASMWAFSLYMFSSF
ncbi:MAG: hypothetical protein Q3991_06350 [Rothia sp. (in: high G+C Gram-positive bacteria)]|uniref:hypothetical protein n=1 Tax=Rothia sp. (in: high G+C Gram-positive bacteria) TaxID=1885016 RepID=UPI0026DC0100|nr:hypothetical protein [Rothia sp. (in: high G+C Gram-positive bacteria)]MDO4884557.1 hypothetical protein [Rothia sp. (in: high G+C Gram-positive bacteria)]